MVYVLDVVEFVEGVYEAFHFFSVFSREFDRVFRNHGDRCVFRFDVVVSQGFFDSIEGFRRRDDFVVFVGNFYVISTGIEGADYIQTTTSIESYVSLCLTMFIIFGCVFEMPLVTIILSKMGIANPEILKKARGVAIVLIFFIAAVVTPPDIVSQCMVAIPMVLLYFVSIFLSGIFYKPRSEDGDDEEDAEEEDED